jgi:class 3 adenylate cyclase/tetratricopeptide (TPR) repeat protein
VIVCPSCGEGNPERARFCLACGSELTATTTAGEERKVVSVLFVDLVGFTARSDKADPEDVRATLRPYHTRVSREIERFGGTVEKFVGDAVMAVFGAPLAHEDDAERAVRSALRILDAISELNEEHGLDLAARAAVATGEAVVSLGAQPGTGEGIATGDVVNTAARLQSEAPVGGLVVNEQTFRRTRDTIDYDNASPVELKGKSEPVPLWRAIGSRSRFGVDTDELAAGPFVGRQRELQLLQSTYERMLGESEIQLVTLTGEPGVGKTRLLAEFRQWVDDRPEIVYWRQGRCLPYGDGITFWALGEIVKAHAGILESDRPADAAAKLAAAVAEMDDSAWLEQRLGPLVGIAARGETEREESFTAWQRFLESVATTRSLVLLFEDLHWADPALLSFIEHLVDWSRDLPILVLCTARPELYERHPTWGGGTRNSTTVSLSPLSSSETEQLVFGLLQTAVLPADASVALLERSGGNPLYAEEYVRLFLEGDSGELLPMPDSVHGIIAARLDTLPPERKALLQDASVLGKVFWGGALAAMGTREPDGVREALHQLARKELVRPARTSSVERDAEYVFWHALIRDVAYGQIPRTARAVKHLAAADWIEEMAGDRAADHAEQLAHHTTEALELNLAAGTDADPELAKRAGRYLVLAGDRALELDTAAARAHYRRALDLIPEPSLEHGLTLLKYGESAQFESKFEEARTVVEQAARELEAVGEPRAAGSAYSLLGNVYYQLGGVERMEEAQRKAIAVLEPLPPGPELVEAYARMSPLSSFMGLPPQEALDWAERAIALGEQLGLRRELIRPLQWRGLMRCELGDLAGIEDLERSLAEVLELRGIAIPAFVNLADQVWRQRGPAAALELFNAAIEYRVNRGGSVPTWPQAESCWPLYDLGDWDDLLRVVDEVLAFEESHGGAQPGGMVLPYASLVLSWRGQTDESAHFAERARAVAEKIEDTQVVGPTLVATALVDSIQGDDWSAVARLQEWHDVTRNRPYHRSQNLTEAVRIACKAGDVDLAERLLDNVVTAAERDRLSALTARAAIGRARGADTTDLFTEASAGWGAFGCVFEHALALQDAGETAAAEPILSELGVPVPPAQTAARTAK